MSLDVLDEKQEATNVIDKALNDMKTDGQDGRVCSVDKVHAIVEEKMKLEKSNRTLKLGLFQLIGAVVLLAAANVGSAFLAVSLSKTTAVQVDGSMTAAHSNEMVKTRGLGYKFEADEHTDETDGSTYYCTSPEGLATLWKEVVDEASSVNFVSKAGKTVEGKNYETLKSMHLRFDAYTDGPTVCFPTENGQSLCADFYNADENVCNGGQGEGRRLEISSTNLETFHRLIGNDAGAVPNRIKKVTRRAKYRSATGYVHRQVEETKRRLSRNKGSSVADCSDGRRLSRNKGSSVADCGTTETVTLTLS